MRTVGVILKEIEDLRKEAKILENMASKIFNDKDVAEYMKETFGTNFVALSGIKSRLEEQANNLEKKLIAYEVEV